MSTTALQITLLGKLSIRRSGKIVSSLGALKLQQLLSYLLLYRDRQHPREALADRFWSDCSTAQARTHLRKALWEVQSAIDDHEPGLENRVLVVDTDWVRVNPEAQIWLDIAELERTFDQVRDVPGEAIDDIRAQHLQAAAEIYHGDLLEGWYDDWCIYERERFLQIYISMLDKLMGYCEVQRRYEQGIAYGARILRYDCAHEQTHRRLMRLHFLSGNRTGALRQYERCAAALQTELGITPTECTTALLTQIRANRIDDHDLPPIIPALNHPREQLTHILVYLYQIQTELEAVRQQVAYNIDLVTQALEVGR